LKLSIGITTKNDITINITEDLSNAEMGELPIIMPPRLKISYQQIKIRLFKAEKLPMLDKNMLSSNSIDAYAKVTFLDFNFKTEDKTVRKDETADWNTEILVSSNLFNFPSAASITAKYV
jgi:hypothetical protein